MVAKDRRNNPLLAFAAETSVGVILFCIGVILLIVVLGAWWTLERHERQYVHNAAQTNAALAKNKLNLVIEERILALERMARRWELADGMSHEAWSVEAQQYFETHHLFHALQWVDKDYVVRWVVPLASNEDVVDLDLTFERSRHDALIKAKETRQTVVSPVIELVQGGLGVLVYAPLYTGDRFDGFMLGVFRLDDLLGPLLEITEKEGYNTVVYDGATLIYRSPQLEQQEVQAYLHWPHAVQLNVRDRQWTIRLQPTRALLGKLHSSLPEVHATIGVLVSLLLMLIVYTMLKYVRISFSLSESEERFRATFDQAAVGIAHVDPSGKWLCVNQKLCDIVGYSREELLTSSFQDITYPDDLDSDLEHVQCLLRGESDTYCMEKRYISKSGALVWVLLTVSLVRSDTGEPKYFISVIEDITQRKEVDETLSRLIEAAPYGILTTNTVGLITLANTEAERVFGYQDGELIGKPVEALVPRPLVFKHVKFRQEYAKAPEARMMGGSKELQGMTKSGDLVDVEVTLAPIDAGHERLMVATVVDVSERVRVQREKERYARELERSNQELEEFAYIASHDLKAPLRGIENLVSWIEEDLPPNTDERTEGYIALLKNRVSRMKGLLDSLLQYSRVGRKEEDCCQVNCSALIEDIVSLLMPPPGFRVEVASEMPTIVTERVPLELVFRNLISNAIKHHDRECGCIRVSASEGEGYCRFKVVDDGPGIEPEYHKRVFDLFQTLKPRDEVEGCGMGLAIVKKVVEYQGGTIAIESRPGERGAGIVFDWPIQRVGGVENDEFQSDQSVAG